MENRDTVSKRKNDKSLWEEIVYLAKLMRSILLYHYRYDEATDNANWCNIIITAGIGTVFGTLATQIILMIFRFHDLGGTVVLPPNGLALFGIAHMPPFDPGVIIVDSLFSLITGFAVLLSLAYITAICLQLWFGEERDKHQLFGFMQVVVIVKSLYLIPLHLIDAVYPDYQEVLLFAEPITLFDTPTKLFTVYVSERFPDFLLFTLTFLSIALPIYSYFVLYRFLRPFKNQVKFFWMRFVLIVVILHGLSVIFWQQIRVFLTPLYVYLLSHAI